MCSVGATNARTPAPRSQRFALEACDRLWALSDVGSSFERLGASCGGRSDVGDDAPFGDCVTRFANVPPNETANRSSRAVSQPSTTIVVEVSSGPAPNSDADQSFMIDPADNSWIVVLASHMEATEGSRERRDRRRPKAWGRTGCLGGRAVDEPVSGAQPRILGRVPRDGVRGRTRRGGGVCRAARYTASDRLLRPDCRRGDRQLTRHHGGRCLIASSWPMLASWSSARFASRPF